VGQVFEMALSPDGKRLAARIRDHASNEDIWIYDTARGIPSRFTFDPAFDRYPVWSADGSTIYFASDRRGSYDLFRKASSGASGEELLLVDSIGNKRPESVSPDGKLLAYHYSEEGSRRNGVEVISLEGNAPAKRFDISMGPIRWTTDGRSLLYIKNESGVSNLWAQPISLGSPKQITHFNSELMSNFDVSRDGKDLLMNRGTANRDVVLIRDAK